MISFGYLSVFVLALAYGASAVDEVQAETTTAPEDVARRELTDTGYVIRYGIRRIDYPLNIEPLLVRGPQKSPVETNEIENEGEKSRPLFYFTTYEPGRNRPRENLPTDRPYIEIRKKRELKDSDIPESSKVGKLRRKRTYCRKCGHGGYGGGYYVPVTYAVYPVYYGGGGGKGCNTCGGGGYGGGGGGGGSFSFSSSHSAAGSFGWGK